MSVDLREFNDERMDPCAGEQNSESESGSRLQQMSRHIDSNSNAAISDWFNQAALNFLQP